ncbi:MAG: hypothetical protein C5B46_07095 [Proteobacteria bacterium]|nr:MAG: hypothetical protein C5B46_07095 [Pseudomonadota bacterium]
MFRALRIFVLVLILIGVAWATWSTKVRSTSWENALRVGVFPIAADGSPATQRYVRTLSADTYRPIAEFMQQEAGRYRLALAAPVEIYLGSEINAVPPLPPSGGNVLQVMLWSLQMRFWAWTNAKLQPKPHVRIFVLYHDPERVTRVAHSLGLQKGLLGVVNAFASEGQAAENNIVIAHELLHTVGATDKYDPRTNQPTYPEGFGDPEREPRFPQDFAELMAGRLAVSETEAEMPRDLAHVLIGPTTAREINWVK